MDLTLVDSRARSSETRYGPQCRLANESDLKPAQRRNIADELKPAAGAQEDPIAEDVNPAASTDGSQRQTVESCQYNGVSRCAPPGCHRSPREPTASAAALSSLAPTCRAAPHSVDFAIIGIPVGINQAGRQPNARQLAVPNSSQPAANTHTCNGPSSPIRAHERHEPNVQPSASGRNRVTGVPSGLYTALSSSHASGMVRPIIWDSFWVVGSRSILAKRIHKRC